MAYKEFTAAKTDRAGDARRGLARRACVMLRLQGRRLKRWLRGASYRFRSLSAAPTPDAPGARLSLWFGVVGLLCILATSMATAVLLSRSMTRTWIAQDERSLSDFVHSAVIAHNAAPFFKGEATAAAMSRELEMMFKVIAASDPVFLAHFYAPDGRIIWSSDAMFVGKVFETNDELGAALDGRTVTEIGELSVAEKPEHELVDPTRSFFVETYIPIFDDGAAPIGVVEVYRTPRHLKAAIDQSHQLIWTSSLLGGLALYLTLGWIARWGDQRLEASARALAENNSLAAIGEVATAVAHGLRNPMAAMRSSAELALDPKGVGADARKEADESRAALKQVVAQVDRLDQWIRALVGCLRTEMLTMEKCDAGELLSDCARHAQRRAQGSGLEIAARLSRRPLPVKANKTALQQVIDCLIDNAIEATPRGGIVTLSAEPSPDGRDVLIEVTDTGKGVDQRIDPFALFLSTKGGGLGVGLPIARRLARRHGGALVLSSSAAGGAIASLRLPLLSRPGV